MRYLLLICLLIAAQASAVPPPPPTNDVMDSVQTFIQSLTSKDLASYGSVLSDNFVAKTNDRPTLQTRTAWLDRMKTAFSNPNFHVTILQVFYGAGEKDVLEEQILLVERTSEIPMPIRGPGGTLLYPIETVTTYSTETLTIEHGKVTRISSSPPYEGELSTAGKRTDIK